MSDIIEKHPLHCNFPEPEVMSSNGLFFSVHSHLKKGKKQQSLTFMRLEWPYYA